MSGEWIGPATGDLKVWHGGQWVPLSTVPEVQPGAVSSDGRVWSGTAWLDPKSPEARALRIQHGTAPAAGSAKWIKPAQDPIARRLTGVIFGLIAVLCAVAAISMQPVFGRDAGGLFMLAALAVAFGFGIAALVKSS